MSERYSEKFQKGFKMKNWKMPARMEPYRDLIVNTGGNSIEDLMNDTKTTMFSNMPRAVLCCCVSSQVVLLKTLLTKNLLKEYKALLPHTLEQKRKGCIKHLKKKDAWVVTCDLCDYSRVFFIYQDASIDLTGHLNSVHEGWDKNES